MAAHQAPPSLGFSRQEHWSGLPFPSPVHESEKWKWSCSVVPDPQRPHEPQPSRLLRPWDFPGKGGRENSAVSIVIMSPDNLWKHWYLAAGAGWGAGYEHSGLICRSPKAEAFPGFPTVQLTNHGLILAQDQCLESGCNERQDRMHMCPALFSQVTRINFPMQSQLGQDRLHFQGPPLCSSPEVVNYCYIPSMSILNFYCKL